MRKGAGKDARAPLRILAHSIIEDGMSLEITGIDIFQPLDLAVHFGRVAPLQVDVGSGAGSFLVEMARRHPEMNFLAIERLLGRTRNTINKATRLALANLRVLRMDGAWVVKHLFPPESTACLHLSFPDPWPKRRHHVNRLVNREFAAAAHRALVPGGEWRITTDHAEYFRVMTACAREFLQETEWTPGPDYPRTDFEKIFASKNLPIHRVRFLKL